MSNEGITVKGITVKSITVKGTPPVQSQTSEDSSKYTCSIIVILPNRYVPNTNPQLSLSQLLSNSLSLDTEISTTVIRTISVINPDILSSTKEKQQLILTFSSNNPKSLRVCIRSFLDMVIIVLRTMAEFDTTVTIEE